MYDNGEVDVAIATKGIGTNLHDLVVNAGGEGEGVEYYETTAFLVTFNGIDALDVDVEEAGAILATSSGAVVPNLVGVAGHIDFLLTTSVRFEGINAASRNGVVGSSGANLEDIEGEVDDRIAGMTSRTDGPSGGGGFEIGGIHIGVGTIYNELIATEAILLASGNN